MTYTVAQLSERYGVSQHYVLSWIRQGDLRAVDVSRSRGGRPRWRITASALDAFEAARTPTPAPARRARRRQSPDVIAFY